jgi:hypothetical protein
LLLISLGLLVFWGTNCEANDCSGFTEKQWLLWLQSFSVVNFFCQNCHA